MMANWTCQSVPKESGRTRDGRNSKGGLKRQASGIGHFPLGAQVVAKRGWNTLIHIKYGSPKRVKRGQVLF